ncbi:MAG: PilN domain-containing protein [Planctomycetota bacterium]|jgi:Tfp pilus assembly PilM family ATPase
MSSKRTHTVTKVSVVAIAREESKLRGVELRKQGEAFEVLWTKDGKASEMNLGMFAGECSLPCEGTPKTGKKGDKIVAAGFDSSGVVFYRLDVPAVKEKELAAIVKLQAESRLPLPAEQMELAWRGGEVRDGQVDVTVAAARRDHLRREVRDGQVDVTVAAARRDHLRRFVEDVCGFEPAKILLDCEGIVKAWREFFSGDEEAAVVASIRSRSTQVCLAEEGKLVNAVSLDMGMEDLSAGVESAGQVETVERFVQDMRSVVELFGYTDSGELPIFVLSDGGSAIEEIASCLESAGLKAKVVIPQMQKLTAPIELDAADIYEYRVPIGLALIAIEARGEELDIFEGLYRLQAKKEKGRWLRSPKVTGAITAVMLALLVTALYAMDVVNDKRLTRLVEKVDVGQFTQRQKLLKSVALQRPDLLRLLNEINSTEHDGIVLSVIHFKKGQLVTVQGQAKNEEQVWKFQKSLRTRKGIKEPRIESVAKKDDKHDFTITFHYGRFTKKRTRL